MTTARIAIDSHMARLQPGRPHTWVGSIPLELPTQFDGSGDALDERFEEVFRFFNRVDEADCDRLDALGYHLPSLSVGDRVQVCWPGCEPRAFRVAGVGFEHIEEGLIP
jgi:hypothetical protein